VINARRAPSVAMCAKCKRERKTHCATCRRLRNRAYWVKKRDELRAIRRQYAEV
jgi:hypothetical protein